MRTTEKVLSGLVLFSLAVFPLQAQAQEGVREPVPHEHVISGSPLILLAGWFNAEYERKVAETLTVGIAGGWLDLKEYDYTNVSGFLRFYPREAAFTGFYLGGRAGVFDVDDGDDSHAALGVGIDVGFSWLLGPGRSFYMGLGLGAARLFSGDLGDAPRTAPSVRLLNIGVAF